MPALSFDDYINENTRNFVGREWVFSAINTWLAEPDSTRILLLQGEPGCGKTAIASRLVQFSQGKASAPHDLPQLSRHFLNAFHFCSSRDRRWLSPTYFVCALIDHLKERNEAYAEALVQGGWLKETHLTAIQNVQSGSPIGFNINTFYANGIPVDDLFSRYIREPLEMFASNGLLQPIVILIDALDEALTFGDPYTIVSLLKRAEELPPQVRFIVTSRDDVRVKDALGAVQEYSFSTADFDQLNRQDIGRYIQERFKEPAIAEQLVAAEPGQARDVTETIARKAEGNFLYVRFLLDAIAQGQRSLAELEGLPEGLEELYYESLERVISIGQRDWTTVYAPLIKLLAVAQESLTFAQLWALAAQPEQMIEKSTLKEYLRNLQQFIEEVQFQENEQGKHSYHSTSNPHYRLYHQSFVDFLHREEIVIKKRLIENRYYFSAEEAHELMAERCGQGGLAESWTKQEESAMRHNPPRRHHPASEERRLYALKYYITHLYYAGEHRWPQLFAVLTNGTYGQEKMRRYDPSARSYVQDLDLGRQATVRYYRDDEEEMGVSPQYLPQLWHYTLLRCSLSSRADQYPPEAFRLLMLLKHRQDEIVGRAELISRPLSRVEALLHIATLATDESERLTLMKHVCEIIQDISDQDEQESALQSLGEALAQFAQQEQVQIILEAIKEPQQRDCALCVLAERLIQRQEWARAEMVIATIAYKKWHGRACYALGSAFARCQHWERAKEIFTAIQDHFWCIRGLCELGASLTETQQEEQARQVWAEIEKCISVMKQPLEQAKYWGQLGKTLTCVRQDAHAEQAWTHAQRLLSRVKDKGRSKLAQCELFIQQKNWDQLTVAVHSFSMRNFKMRIKAQQMQYRALIEDQQWERLNQIVAAVRSRSVRSRVRGEMIAALAQARQWEQLQEIIDVAREENAVLYMDALYLQAVALAQAGRWQEAQDVIELIEDDTRYNGALYVLACEFAQAKQWKQARTTIEMIEERGWQIKAWCKLGIELAQNQQEQEAKTIWEKAETLIGTFQERHAQNQALYRLEQAMKTAGEKKPGIQSVQSQRDHGTSSAATKPVEVLFHRQQLERIITELPNSEIKASILQELAAALCLGQYWEQASEVIDTIQDREKRIKALLEQGKLLMQAGQAQRAQQVWQEVQAALPLFVDETTRCKLYRELTEALLDTQQWEQAQEVIALMTDKENRIGALGKLGAASLLVQQRDQAEEAWTEALVITCGLEPKDEKDQALCAIARALAEAQQWRRAELVIKGIRHKSFKATALSKLGEMLMLAQEKERAEQVWQQTEQLINTLTAEGARDVALRALSAAFLHTQRWDDAERVIAAIQGGTLRVRSLAELGYALLQAQQWERAEKAWLDAEEVIDIISISNDARVMALIELARGFTRARRWEDAEQVWIEIKEALNVDQEDEDEESIEEQREPNQPETAPIGERKRRRNRGRRGRRPSLAKLTQQAQSLGINIEALQEQAKTQDMDMRELLKTEISKAASVADI